VLRSVRIRIVTLLVGLVLVLPSTAFGRAHYLCRMMDRVVASPCCADDRDEDQIQEQQQARAPDCCVRIAPSARAVAPSVRAAAVLVPGAALAAIAGEPTYVPARGRDLGAATPQARAPPPLGPPLFLTHCSLLI